MDKLSLATLGTHIQDLRNERGLSLSQLATNAGIAKSNLSRLEQGKGNPTIDTIWRLATQLNVPFGNMVSPISAAVGDQDILVRLIDQGKDTPKVDVYWMSCAANTTHKAESHGPDTRESITVISGQIKVGSETERAVIGPGETHSFVADCPHAYQTFDQPAIVIVTVIYGKIGVSQ